MSKKQKQQEKLFSTPAPTDYAWDDLVTVMRRNGFTERCNGGSHYIFQHMSGYTFSMSKTHPSGILKSYQVKYAKEALLAVSKHNGD
jgi:predicted RNA binding protein YcfA (HicA-like mRNA interferase family)